MSILWLFPGRWFIPVFTVYCFYWVGLGTETVGSGDKRIMLAVVSVPEVDIALHNCTYNGRHQKEKLFFFTFSQKTFLTTSVFSDKDTFDWARFPPFIKKKWSK